MPRPNPFALRLQEACPVIAGMSDKERRNFFEKTPAGEECLRKGLNMSKKQFMAIVPMARDIIYKAELKSVGEALGGALKPIGKVGTVAATVIPGAQPLVPVFAGATAVGHRLAPTGTSPPVALPTPGIPEITTGIVPYEPTPTFELPGTTVYEAAPTPMQTLGMPLMIGAGILFFAVIAGTMRR